MIPRSFLRPSRALCSTLPHPFHPLPSRYASRLPRYSTPYSTAPDPNPDSTAHRDAPPAASPVNDDPAADDPLRKELEAKNREIIDLKDKYLRSIADFRNLQERTKRDVAAARDFAITRFAKDLLDSVDNLDRALGTVDVSKLPTPSSPPPDDSSSPSPPSSSSSDPSDPPSSYATDLRNLHEGLQMTSRVLMQTLAKHGLERIDPAATGERFDPNRHEALFQTRVEGKEEGSVFATQQTGFLLNGRVVRAAKVGVVKNS